MGTTTAGRAVTTTWLWVIGIGLILYIANASMLIYVQATYYQNPSYIDQLISVLPYTQQYEQLFQGGVFGILGTISIILILAMTYLLTSIIISGRAGTSTRVALIVLTLLQLFMGNVGLVIGLILVLVGSILMR